MDQPSCRGGIQLPFAIGGENLNGCDQVNEAIFRVPFQRLGMQLLKNFGVVSSTLPQYRPLRCEFACAEVPQCFARADDSVGLALIRLALIRPPSLQLDGAKQREIFRDLVQASSRASHSCEAINGLRSLFHHQQ